jgi:putative transcriptional regulator
VNREWELKELSELGELNEETNNMSDDFDEELDFDNVERMLQSTESSRPRPEIPIPQKVHYPERRHPDWRLTNCLFMMRAVKNMTQTELGEKVGVSRQTISNIEQRHHEPALSLALAIAEAMDMRVDELFHLKRPKFGLYE